MIPSDETRHQLVRLLQLAYSGEKAAALAYRGHSRSVRDLEEKAMIAKIEQDEWVHREKVGRLLAQLEARPLRSREIRSSLVGHALSLLCRFTGWFLPMYFAGKLETQNVCQYDKAAEYAAALGRPELIPDLMEMAAVEIEHEKFFLGVRGRSAPGQRRCE
jgi:demethoxyubiquinone hydroxylase (CLK1/Coq7/Cat5 family)